MLRNFLHIIIRNNMKVSDYVVHRIMDAGIDRVFSITGGFAMHLNDSFGRFMDVVYNHHEQACGYAAVGFTSATLRPSVVCTTAGCAATNAISPCATAYQDSVPVLFVSGQVNSGESIRTLHKKGAILRHYAGADVDIVSIVSGITKFACEPDDPNDVPSCMDRILHELTSGRPGPVWLSIPLNIQGAQLVVEGSPLSSLPTTLPPPSWDTDAFLRLWESSERPLLIVGNGARCCRSLIARAVDTHNVPVVVSFHGTDVIESDDPHFIGKIGILGDRAGNFCVQNADLLIILGCRMAQAVVGYRPEWFSRESKRVHVDIDPCENAKDNIRYDMRINNDIRSFLSFLVSSVPPTTHDAWMDRCAHWRQRWGLESPPPSDNRLSPYMILRRFFEMAPGDKIITATSGSILPVAWHCVRIKGGDRFICSNQGEMGFELPCAIGCAIGRPGASVFTILGEGALQLNIQELQTVVHHNLNVKIILMNNDAYGAIKTTQTNFFKAEFGVDSSSGVSFPDNRALCEAYGLRHIAVHSVSEIDAAITDMIGTVGPMMAEFFVKIEGRHPRLSAKTLSDGTFVNRPFEDMSPFLEPDDFEREMIISSRV